MKAILSQTLIDKIKSEITEGVLKELNTSKFDSQDKIDSLSKRIDAIVDKSPKFDELGVIAGTLKEIKDTASKNDTEHLKSLIWNPDVRNKFAAEVLDQIRVPKDGEDGADGDKGKAGKNYILKEEDRLDIAEKIPLDDFITNEKLLKSLSELSKRLKKDFPRNRGGGLEGDDLLKEITKLLGTDDWKFGLPSNGQIEANLPYVNFTENFTGPIPDEAGVLDYNDAELSLNLNTGVGPVLQIGQEIYILICNNTGSLITNFTALRPVSAVVKEGLIIPTVEKAKADNFATMEGTLMVSTMDIPHDAIGLATRFGRIRNADTSAFSDGAGLFVSATVAGKFTDVAPAFPNWPISMGGVLKSGVSDGEFIMSVTRNIFDTTLNFWNGVFRETINFTVSSNGTVVTGALSPANGHPDMTMMFSDGFSTLTTTPPATITLTAGTDDDPQENFIYVLKSTKALTLSTSDWPTAEHIRVASVVLRSAATTDIDDAYKNQNHNDHIEDTGSLQGHLSHIASAIREKIPATWKSGVEGSASGFPNNFYVATTAGMVRQLHLQSYLSTSMPTDDIHIVNHPTTPNVTVSNLNGQTVDALGNSLANSSFSFVIWGIQNKTGTASHLICNLPTGKYSKNNPANAVSDAFNYATYDIPASFQGVGFLIARFTVVLEANGTTWSLFDTENLRGRIPNSTAGGGGGGTGVTTILGLTDTPSAFTGFKGQPLRVNEAETAMEFVALKSGTLASPPSGLHAGEHWLDTTDSANHPIQRISTVIT